MHVLNWYLQIHKNNRNIITSHLTIKLAIYWLWKCVKTVMAGRCLWRGSETSRSYWAWVALQNTNLKVWNLLYFAVDWKMLYAPIIILKFDITIELVTTTIGMDRFLSSRWNGWLEKLNNIVFNIPRNVCHEYLLETHRRGDSHKYP